MIEEFDIEYEIAALEREVESDIAVVEMEQNKQQEQAIQSSSDEWQAIIAQLLAPTFAVMAPNWGVQQAEIDGLAGAYAPLLAKYFPDTANVGPEIGAVIVTAAVIVPRLSIPRKLVDSGSGAPEPEPSKPKSGKPKKKQKPAKNNVSQLQSERDR